MPAANLNLIIRPPPKNKEPPLAYQRYAAVLILYPPTARSKDGIDFIRAIKTKIQPKINL
jgi:hypothetical protein